MWNFIGSIENLIQISPVIDSVDQELRWTSSVPVVLGKPKIQLIWWVLGKMVIVFKREDVYKHSKTYFQAKNEV